MNVRTQAALDWTRIVLFAAALLAPAVDALLRPEARRDVELEARSPEPFPALDTSFESLREFPRGVEAWWGDALGLRDVLLHWDSRARVQIFRVAPGEPLLVGRDDWVFPTLLGILDASRGRAQLTRARLEAWRKALESRRAFCAALGAEYRVALAPEKSSIYPERLPDGWGPIGPGVQDQLVAWLGRHSDFRLVDLRPALLAEKARDRAPDFAYYPLGTHWTDRGGYAVHRVLVDALRPRFPLLAPVNEEHLAWELDPAEGDTWAHRLRLSDELHQQARVITAMHRGFEGPVEREGGVTRVRGGLEDAPSLLVFHDSFGERVSKLLALRFARSTFVFAPQFDPERVRAEHPDVVIELFAERRLLLDHPSAIVAGGGDAIAREFEASAELLFALDPLRDPAAVRGVDGTRVSRVDGGFLLEHDAGAAGLVEIDAPEFPSGRTCLARIELESDHADKLDVLYRTQRLPRFHRGQIASATTSAGRQTLYVELDALDLLGPLRLRAGARAGRYVLRSFELRLAAP
ncbi:MAG: hypothetical protein HZA53_06180 [Planctomycetes bacterium]|nr:hypothetical protein [Planctomycetota bacterium]